MVNNLTEDEITEPIYGYGGDKMEKYEQLSVVGEGSYGVVMKCRHKETDTVVAIKKFLETEEDATVRKMALREIRMLKKLKHENLVTMIEVFRNRKRFYIVFEYVEGTILDELEKYPEGLGDEKSRDRIYQVTRAVQFCHINHIIHRDVKPENILISSRGVIKLCDFGFARLISSHPDAYTEYVATRWYRAPELLVGEAHYGPPVDIWAIGCLFSEMMTGEPLFPGESDIDQLYLIVKLIGKPCTKHQHLMSKNTQFRPLKRATAESNLYKEFPSWSLLSLDFLSFTLKMDPAYRPSAEELLKHNYFNHDRFTEKFLPALKEKVKQEYSENPLLRKYKAEVLMPEPPPPPPKEKKDYRRASSITATQEPPKWRIQFLNESIKRKLSSECTSHEYSPTESRNYVNVSRVGSKLGSVQQKISFKTNQLQVLKRDEKPGTSIIESTLKASHSYTPKLSQDKSETSTRLQKDNPRLEKALDLLTKLNQKNAFRPKSTTKDLPRYTASSHMSPSPPDFQSLQSHSFREPMMKSPSNHATTVLHPTITNISFPPKDAKNSPFLIQSVNNMSLKSVFNQVPITNAPKVHHLKRLDRSVVLDTTTYVDKNVMHKSPPEWLTSIGLSQNKKDFRGKVDEFTLPTVPGATGSPPKSKKRTPEYPSSKNHSPAKKSDCNVLSKVIKYVTLKPPPVF